jgi:hypothetical protein
LYFIYFYFRKTKTKYDSSVAREFEEKERKLKEKQDEKIALDLFKKEQVNIKKLAIKDKELALQLQKEYEEANKKRTSKDKDIALKLQKENLKSKLNDDEKIARELFEKEQLNLNLLANNQDEEIARRLQEELNNQFQSNDINYDDF